MTRQSHAMAFDRADETEPREAVIKFLERVKSEAAHKIFSIDGDRIIVFNVSWITEDRPENPPAPKGIAAMAYQLEQLPEEEVSVPTPTETDQHRQAAKDQFDAVTKSVTESDLAIGALIHSASVGMEPQPATAEPVSDFVDDPTMRVIRWMAASARAMVYEAEAYELGYITEEGW